tara:strand:+ start:626 stop:796 length:171 start_codon:yes stop_codon:yes gene_type:complete
MTNSNNLDLLKNINDQVRKDWDIPDECTDEVVMFDVVKETLTRYSKLTVEKVTKND